MKLLSTFVILLSAQLVTSTAWSVDVKNPLVLCERFISEEQQKECAAKIEKISPDWYLASTCDLVFDHDQFYQCLTTPVSKNWNPNALQSCQNESQTDKDRLNCVQMAANTTQADSDKRMPASDSKPNPLKEKKLETKKESPPTVLPKKRFD